MIVEDNVMTVTPGASLDNAIAGINRGLDNARKVAAEINKETAPKTDAKASAGKATGDGRVGTNLNLTA